LGIAALKAWIVPKVYLLDVIADFF
jgi:hypothetical protein